MGERNGTPRGLDRSGSDGGGFVTFEMDPKEGTPLPPEEIYEPPSSARFTPSPSPAPIVRSVRPVPVREELPDLPSASALRRNAEVEQRPASRWPMVIGVMALLGLGCTGVAAVGLGVVYTQFRPEAVPVPVPVPVPVEVAPAEPEPPEELGGIPLEKGLRRGPATAPRRPEVPTIP